MKHITLRVKARGVVRRMSGVCDPLLVDCEGDSQYVVKFAKNPERERVLIAELVCHELANCVGVPVAEHALVEVSPALAAQAAIDYPWVTAGLHFGSKFLSKTYQFPSPNMALRALNVHKVPSIIGFDYLVYNIDRAANEKNLLYSRVGDAWELVAIDFSHAFYMPIWDETMLRQRKGEYDHELLEGRVYRRLLPCVNGNSPFNPFFASVAGLSADRIRHIIDSVPGEWGLSRGESEHLFDFLVSRATSINQGILGLRHFMPYWKGGEH